MAKLLNLRQYRQFSSALYITGDKAKTNYAFLTPIIDFEEKIQHKTQLSENIKARNLNIDLDKLEKRWNFYKMIDSHLCILKQTQTELYNEINRLKQDQNNVSELDKLQLHVKLVRDDYKNVRDYSYELEENTMLSILSLPNDLHLKTPKVECLIKEFYEKPEKSNVSHMEIGKNLIDYYNPFFYFLKSDAALFEYASINYFQTNLVNFGYNQFSNADFARSIVLEGCGTNYLDKSNVFTLNEKMEKSYINKLHLVGGGSLYSFMSYFTKHSVIETYFPLYYFSCGRRYKPVNNKANNLFNVNQNSVISIFIATLADADINEMLDKVIKEICQLYEPLKYHFKLVYIPANQLENCESLKISIQMFSCYLQSYIEIGYVSLYDDYLSKRLLFTYGKDRRFPKIISGQLVNIQAFLGCALENNSKLSFDLLKNYIP